MATHDPTADCELIELGRAFEAAWAYETLVFEGTEDVLTEEADRMCNDAMAAVGAIAHQIENIPARTLEGIKVKARVVAWCLCGEISDLNRYSTTQERVLETLILDLVSPAV